MVRYTSAAFAVACLTSSALGVHLHGRDINEPLLESYDYIVVGCGISGLVVTNRLSEIASRTVLCIEAGIPDHYEAVIQDPVFVGADIGGIYDWNLATVPQTQLDGNTRPMPQGKALGGGSILNAMCWNRGGSDDFDAWEALGNPGWGWEGILPYFIKSETYTPVYSEEIAEGYSINYNPAVHGTSGPVQVSYPKYFYPQSINFFAGMNLLGLPTQFDPNDGSSAGPAFVPTDLDPNNQTRSDARRTYFDPYVSRSNFHVITGQHVTRVLIEGVGSNNEVDNPTAGGNDSGNGPSSGNNDGFGFGPGGSATPLAGQNSTRFTRRQDPGMSNLRINGVEFSPNASAPRQTVYATREVIIAAGALHSAQLLQLSGIGPVSLLNEFDIPVALDLPGVGNNLQDHCLVGTFYPYNNASYPSPTELTTNATFNAEAEQEYEANKTGPWTAGSPNALAFNPLPLISNNSASILSDARNQDPTEYLVAGLDPTIVAGFSAQKQSLATRLAENTVAAYEIINNNAGSLTLAVMHPFSRGTCYIQSADPFEPPAIDPRWLTNPVDRQVLIEALLFNRQILATPPMAELQPAQFVPPADADTDALNQVINSGIRTVFHPSGTLAMLPLEHGGVVDSRLLVWGTQNLRVVDAGIFPVIPAAHLQAVVYGVAEKAADIIKADNLPSSAISTASSSSASLLAESTMRSPTAISNVLAGRKPVNSTVRSFGSNSAIMPAGFLPNSTAQSVAISTSFSARSTTVLSVRSSASTILSETSSAISLASYQISATSRPSLLESSLSHSSNSLMPLSSSSPIDSGQRSSTSREKVTSGSVIIATHSSSSSVLPTSASQSVPPYQEILTSGVSSTGSETRLALTTGSSSTREGLLLPSEVTATGRPSTPIAPPASLPGPEQLASSVVGMLTSVGVPSPIVSSLVPIIMGSPPESGGTVSASSRPIDTELQQEEAALFAFIRWLVSFLRLKHRAQSG